MATLTMTWQEFLRDATAFLKISEQLKDQWILFKQNDDEGGSFLIYKQKIPFPREHDANIQSSEFCASLPLNSDESIQDIQHTASSTVDWLQIEYHIVYSISYQVPILYFLAHKSDGSILGLEEAWQLFRNVNDDSTADKQTAKNREEMLSILTQMEHPVLFKPYLALHPCRTAELLAQSGNSANYILTFISLMGPYVHLQLSNAYGLGFA